MFAELQNELFPYHSYNQEKKSFSKN